MLTKAITRGLRAPAHPAQLFRSAALPQRSRGFASSQLLNGPKKPNFNKPLKTPTPPPKPSTSSQSNAKSAFTAADAQSKAATEKSTENSTPGASQPKAASTENEAPEADEYTGPLPDLTKGIPSTLEFETAGNTSAGKSAPTGLNLTEDPSYESGGKGRRELPASAYVSSSEKRRLKVANYMYLSFFAGCIIGAGYFGRDWETEEEERKHADDAPSGLSIGLWWARVKARASDHLNYYNEPAFQKLLPDPDPMFERPYTLVISLEDLLIHSEWTRDHGWRVAKRPGVDYFLRYLSQYYELVVWTSVPWSVAEPVITKLDPYRIITWPLFREATKYENGEYVKDLSYLNRDLSKVIMIDTDPTHAKGQPENAIILPKWQGDVRDKELVALIPFLEYIHTMGYSDVRTALKSFEGTHIPTEFAKREAIQRQKFHEEISKQKKRTGSGVSFLSKALGVKPQPAIDGEQSLSEALAQGKMLQDIARERGQRNYEALEKEIRENGEKWLKEEAANQEKAKEEGMRAMKNSITGVFGVPGANPSSSS